jgi:protein phosphatase
MTISIPDFCLALVLGEADALGAAARLFGGDEVVRAGRGASAISTMLGMEQALARAAARLAERRLVAVLADGLGGHARASFAATAKSHFAKAVVLLGGEEDDPAFAASAGRLAHEGFAEVLSLAAALRAGRLHRVRLDVDRRDEAGPFDIIGDVHGCTDELEALLARLGYSVTLEGMGDRRRAVTTAPPGRRAIFVGDLVDRGPRPADALRIAMAMVAAGQAYCVPGNHDVKALRWLKGARVKVAHGLQATIDDMAAEAQAFREAAVAFLERLPIHLWLDGGRLVVVHAGIRADMIGRVAPRVREFCLYGDTSGESDALGLPIRYHWAADYRGASAVVYGHTPVPAPEWVNGTLCLDTGCCFGGALTAIRWPEREIVAVPARRAYAERLRPFGHPPVRPAGARRGG